MSLFSKGRFKLNSGQISDFKIDCDHLSGDDIDTLAYLISTRVKFREVLGVPTGGCRLAAALEPYCQDDEEYPTLIVEDVVTTGGSMERFRKQVVGKTIGITIFARGKCPDWVQPIFQMW